LEHPVIQIQVLGVDSPVFLLQQKSAHKQDRSHHITSLQSHITISFSINLFQC